MRVNAKQHLIFDADDTLWENNIYFEQAFDEFCAYLNHSSLTPDEIRGILDDIEPFTTLNPSAENIAWYICEKLQEGIKQDNPVEVAEVKVWETDIQSATYRPAALARPVQ